MLTADYYLVHTRTDVDQIDLLADCLTSLLFCRILSRLLPFTLPSSRFAIARIFQSARDRILSLVSHLTPLKMSSQAV